MIKKTLQVGRSWEKREKAEGRAARQEAWPE